MVMLESLAVASAVRQRDDPPIDNPHEVLAAGLANVAGAFTSTLPSAGGFSQTAVNERAGARTQLAALVTAGVAVLVALFLGPVLSDLPQATLAAMVVVAVIGLIQPTAFARLARVNPVELAIAVVTTIVGLTAGLLGAVAVGVVLTFAVILHELNHPDLDPLAPLGRPRPGLLVLRLGGPLYTANVRGVTAAMIEDVDATAGDLDVVVLDMSVQGRLSTTVLDSLGETAETIARYGAELWFAGLPDRARDTARRTRAWQEAERSGRVHDTVDAAFAVYDARSRPKPTPD